MSPCIMGLTTQDPYNQEGHTELYKIFKFRVNWANFEQDTAVQKPQNLLRNVWISGQVFGNPYINKASPKQSHQSRFFLCFFYYLFNNRNPIYKLSTAIKRKKNRTEQSYHYSRGRIPKLLLQLQQDNSKGYAKIQRANYQPRHRQRHTVDG